MHCSGCTVGLPGFGCPAQGRCHTPARHAEHCMLCAAGPCFPHAKCGNKRLGCPPTLRRSLASPNSPCSARTCLGQGRSSTIASRLIGRHAALPGTLRGQEATARTLPDQHSAKPGAFQAMPPVPPLQPPLHPPPQHLTLPMGLKFSSASNTSKMRLWLGTSGTAGHGPRAGGTLIRWAGTSKSGCDGNNHGRRAWCRLAIIPVRVGSRTPRPALHPAVHCHITTSQGTHLS